MGLATPGAERSTDAAALTAGATARFCALTYTVSNLGDEIQTLAALQYLPEDNVGLVAREWLHNNRWSGRLRIILNGWFMHEKGHWPPAPHFDPLIISFHAASHMPELLEGAGGDYLRACSRIRPVGARDLSTAERLRAKGIDAYFSGCLTLTFRRFSGVIGTDSVFAVDLDDEEAAQLQKMTGRPIVRLRHGELVPTAPWERLRKAESLLRAYQGAAAVVTTRLHAALPALALGTPALLIRRETSTRFTGLVDFLHHASRTDFLAGRVAFDVDDPPPAPTGWEPLADDMRRACEAFTGIARHEPRLAPDPTRMADGQTPWR